MPGGQFPHSMSWAHIGPICSGKRGFRRDESGFSSKRAKTTRLLLHKPSQKKVGRNTVGESISTKRLLAFDTYRLEQNWTARPVAEPNGTPESAPGPDLPGQQGW